MRSCLLVALFFTVGCGQSTPAAAPASGFAVVEQKPPADDQPADDQTVQQLRQLARVQWQHETQRMKEREIVADTDPEAWAIVASARALRMIAIGDADEVETILPIMLVTDEAFWKSDPPADSTILLYGDFVRSYRAAALISEQKLRIRGMNELADKLHRFVGEPQ